MGENKEAFMSHCECVLWRRILKENAKFSPFYNKYQKQIKNVTVKIKDITALNYFPS